MSRDVWCWLKRLVEAAKEYAEAYAAEIPAREATVYDLRAMDVWRKAFDRAYKAEDTLLSIARGEGVMTDPFGLMENSRGMTKDEAARYKAKLQELRKQKKVSTHGSRELDEDAEKLRALGADPGPTWEELSTHGRPSDEEIAQAVFGSDDNDEVLDYDPHPDYKDRVRALFPAPTPEMLDALAEFPFTLECIGNRLQRIGWEGHEAYVEQELLNDYADKCWKAADQLRAMLAPWRPVSG